MSSTTTKGVPYPVGTDAASSLDTIVQSLAEWVDAQPGVAALTTTARNALSGGSLWAGRTIWNTTLQRVEVYTGSSWVGPSEALSKGRIAHSIVTSTQSLPELSEAADVTGFSVTWTAVSSRLYRVSYLFNVNSSDGSPNHTQFQITDGSNAQLKLDGVLTGGEAYGQVSSKVLRTGVSGSTTCKVRYQLGGGTANYSLVTTSSPTNPGYILVEDLGLA